MTTINPVSIQHSPNLVRRPGFPPALDPLRVLMPKGAVRPGDDAAGLTGATRGATGLLSLDDARRGLGELSGLLDQLKDQVGRIGAGGATEDAQRTIDDLVDSIEDAAQRTGLKDLGTGFSILDVARQVTNLSVYNVRLAPGQEEKVEVDIRTSAQQAALFMNLRGGRLELANNTRSFTIEVTGRTGSAELTFANGTSAEEIAKAVNAVTKKTGVEAHLSGDGLRFETYATGSAESLTVRVIDDGGAADDAGAFYRLKADNLNEFDPDTYMHFDSIIGRKGIRDLGQDAEVWVNGQKAAVYGSQVLASSDKFTALFFLDRLTTDGPNAQRLGKFIGFTIKANGQIIPNDQDKPRQPEAGAPDGPAAPDGTRRIGADTDVIPPPQKDYGTPGIDTELPIEPPLPDYGTDRQPEAGAPSPVPPGGTDDGPGGPGGPGGKGSPMDDLVAATTGPAINPDSVRGAIDRLLHRIRGQSGALDLVERLGLTVVPPSLGPVVGSPAPQNPNLDFPSALDAARAIRDGIFTGGRAADLVGGTTSAQVLRLLGQDPR